MRIKKTSETTPYGGAVVNVQNDSTTNTYSCNFINELTGVVLWTNENPTSSFASQTITLNDDLNNYTYYEVIYGQTHENSNTCSTGKVITPNSANLTLAVKYNVKRSFTVGSSRFNDCYIWTTYGGGETVNNTYLIPYQIIGYK